MTNIFLFFIPTLMIMLFVHYLYKQHFTIKEFIAQVVFTFVIILCVVFFDGFNSLHDVKYIHGHVTAKEGISKSCNQNWSTSKDWWCENYYTKLVPHTRYNPSSKKVEVYYTTYYKAKYPWEKNWYIHTTIGDYKIDRVDQQGVREPQRYKIVEKNDPVTSTENYLNYIKASGDSLYKSVDENPEFVITRNDIYDYYNINNFYVYGYDAIDIIEANSYISRLNSKVTKANVVVYITTDNVVAESLQAKWQGFKINDVVIDCHLDIQSGMCDRVTVYSWSEKSIVNYEIENLWLNKKVTEYKSILENTFNYIESDYVEPAPEKYDYLKYRIQLSDVAFYILILIVCVATPLISIFFVKNDL